MRELSIYLVILAFLSFNPWLRPDSGEAISNIAWDKIDHAAAYCLLSLLCMSAYRYYKKRWLVSLMVLLTSPLVGLLFEYCQLWLTPTRQFSYYDAVANAFGAVLGVAIFWCYWLFAKSAPNK